MKTMKVSARILAVSALAVLFEACSPPEEQLIDEQQNRAVAPTGCCQRTATSCSDAVTKSECDGLGGVFQEGKSCRTDSGTCVAEQ